MRAGRKPSVHEIDFSPRESSQNDNNNNNNNNIVRSKTRTEFPPPMETENKEKRKKKEKEKKIDIFSDLKGLSNISGEDIDKIVPNFGPLPKKNISKAIKQEAIMYLNDFLDEKYKSNILAASALKLKGGNVMSTMKGPHHCSIDIQLFGDLFACKSISTYPERVHFHTRDGDPICDRYFVKLFENRIFASLSDGYSWGERSRKAAKKACKASTLYIEKRHKDYKNLKDFATGIMEGFADAHRRVLEGVSEAIWESGATTLLNCNLIELDESIDDFKLLLKNGVRAKWALVGGNLGDTKAFLYSHSTQKVVDLTKRTRAGLSSDPGGKLGNYVDGKPDLRNYNLFVRGCEENDLVLLMTDGVYDNYNPVKLGFTPEDFKLNESNWESLDYAVVSKVISKHIREELGKIIKSRTGSLSDICYKILDDCVKITENQRQFCTENPADRVPNDAKLYSGSLGHATIIVFSVGYVTLNYNKFMGK